MSVARTVLSARKIPMGVCERKLRLMLKTAMESLLLTNLKVLKLGTRIRAR